MLTPSYLTGDKVSDAEQRSRGGPCRALPPFPEPEKEAGTLALSHSLTVANSLTFASISFFFASVDCPPCVSERPGRRLSRFAVPPGRHVGIRNSPFFSACFEPWLRLLFLRRSQGLVSGLASDDV